MSLEIPGLDVSGRVRARDIQMAAVADLRRRVLMVSGAIDVREHDLAVSIHLPAPGRWQVIKSETNLTDQTWVAMQVVTDQDTVIVSETPGSADSTAMIMSRQFAKSFVTPDGRRLVFYDGEVRPGEAVLKVFTIETEARRPAYAHARYSPVTVDPEELGRLVADGLPQRPVVELLVPVTVIG